MKVTMTVHNLQDEVVKIMTMQVKKHKIGNLVGPGLEAATIYRLKKTRKLEVPVVDGRIVYELTGE